MSEERQKEKEEKRCKVAEGKKRLRDYSEGCEKRENYGGEFRRG